MVLVWGMEKCLIVFNVADISNFLKTVWETVTFPALRVLKVKIPNEQRQATIYDSKVSI